MDKEFKDIDGLFKEKLENYSVKPSENTWEKLNGKLNPVQKKYPLWKLSAAASVLMVLGMAFLFWIQPGLLTDGPQNLSTNSGTNFNDPDKEMVQDSTGLAEIYFIPEIMETEKELIPEKKELTENKKVKKPAISHNKTLEIPELNLEYGPIASREQEIPDVPEIEVPEPLNTDLLADTGPIYHSNGVGYTVRIISNGFALNQKETLVEEIENKIDKIGGLLHKVDQGFAELQDAKNDLFVALITKKEKNKN